MIELSGFWIPITIGALADRAGLRTALGTFVVLGLAMVALAANHSPGNGINGLTTRVSEW